LTTGLNCTSLGKRHRPCDDDTNDCQDHFSPPTLYRECSMTTMTRLGWWIISLMIGVIIDAIVVAAMALAIREAGFGIGPAAYLVPPLALAIGTAGAFTLIEKHILGR
jgi:hypothetical protein